MSNKIDNLLSRTGDIALRRRAKWILEKINSKNRGSILDIGCGDGFYLHLLYALFPKANIVGVDNDKNALRSARVNLKGKNVKVKHTDIYNLRFPENSFDVVILSEVLEHLDDDRKGLQQVYRVLRSNGLLLVTVPHCNYPLFWDPINWFLERMFHIHIQKGFWAGIWNQHLRLYSGDALYKAIKCGGFKKIEIVRLTHYVLPFNHYLINIVARILASRKSYPKVQQLFSKYQVNTKMQSKFNLFTPIFMLDKLNDRWSGSGSAVSLVGIAKK